jgi:hypothetical protein
VNDDRSQLDYEVSVQTFERTRLYRYELNVAHNVMLYRSESFTQLLLNFQVIGTKKIEADQTNLKYRLCLSDGVHRFSQAMLQLADQETPVPTGKRKSILF